MSSRLYQAISEVGTHEIGDLNTKWAKRVTNGAKAKVDFDNFIIVEITGRDAEGNLECQPLSVVTNEGFLATTIEEEHLLNIGGYQETYRDFFNGKGEMVQLTRPETGIRFDTSAFSLNAGVTSVTRGMVAHFDPATKKYIISDAGTPHADFATAKNQFEVVDEDSDFGYGYDVTTIKLECK